MNTQTQRNDVGQKIAKRIHSDHIAKIVKAAKESAIATAIAVEDYHKTCEVEKIVAAAKECRKNVNFTISQITAAYEATINLKDAGNLTAYDVGMKSITDQIAPSVQAAEATLRAVNDKLMRAGLEITAERWDLLTAGSRGRAHGCTLRLEMIEKALGSNKPKKARAKQTATQS